MLVCFFCALWWVLCCAAGISVPCVEDGYWRDPAAEQHHDIGDFSAYNIYRCEVHDVCNGENAMNAMIIHVRPRHESSGQASGLHSALFLFSHFE